ncbi:MAG TPA: DegT/DnrJ/EryC1/StrS family aminotransferase [bacterium]|nr:DegT/DnrJ/EryC1/StrS family aminotransferase [bacterium]
MAPNVPATMEIPYKFPYPVTEEAQRAVADVLRRRIHYFGPYTDALETKLAALSGARRAVAASSGSACLLLGLHACGVGAGDEVIMPANIYAGVPEAALQLGAAPVLVDIDPRTYNIAVEHVEAVLSPRTRAIAVQHSYGHAVDMDPLRRLAEPRGVRILEDAAHALGGRYKGRPTGGLGDVGVFAFSNKGISACGVGGAATAADERLAQDLLDRRYHGRRAGYETHVLGYNFRLTEMVAAVASCQLDELPAWNARRRRNAEDYTRHLRDAGVPLTLPVELPYTEHTFLHYVVRLDARDALMEHLRSRGVSTSVHYPVPVHRHAAFAGRLPYREGEFPTAEAACREILSLPCHPAVGEAEVEYVVGAVAAFYRGRLPRGRHGEGSR